MPMPSGGPRYVDEEWDDVAMVKCDREVEDENIDMSCKVGVYTDSPYGTPGPNVTWPGDEAEADITALLVSESANGYLHDGSQGTKVEFDPEDDVVCELRTARGKMPVPHRELACGTE